MLIGCSRDSANAAAPRILPYMDTFDTPKPASIAASALPLAADDPRLTPEAIEYRRANGIAERDQYGRLLPGSQLQGKGRKGGPMVTTLARRYTEAAVSLLGKMIEDEKAPPAARVAAAQALLDRGWGKAPIQIDLNVKAKFDDFLRDIGIAVATDVIEEATGDYPDGRDDDATDQEVALLLGQGEAADVEVEQD
jgi:hypothetical protein